MYLWSNMSLAQMPHEKSVLAIHVMHDDTLLHDEEHAAIAERQAAVLQELSQFLESNVGEANEHTKHEDSISVKIAFIISQFFKI
jgi:hypothetical protein